MARPLTSRDHHSGGSIIMMTLESWLNQATRHLAADSASQVRTEIREHFESAREAALTDGATAADADQIALSSLGDPKIANRQYRRVLLTSAEARLLRESSCEARTMLSRPWLKWLLIAVPFFTVAASIALWFRGQAAARDVLVIGIGLIPLLGAPLLPIYTPVRGRMFRCVKWLVITGMFALIFGTQTLNWSWLLIACLWQMLWSDWTRAAIRRKLPESSWPKNLYL